jgi:phage/plasmid-like protein (TIGR03299 family)
MAHELTVRSNGRAEAFYAGNGKVLNPAWHGLGTNVLDAPNSESAIKLAGLDWEVQKVEAAAKFRRPHSYAGEYLNAPGFFATMRADNYAVLGFVGDKYVPVQNVQAFDFLDGLNQDGIVKYESAGSLKGGRIVWVLARMGSIVEVAKGDGVQPYILFSTAHDGTRSLRIVPTTVRVVCANTLRIALGAGAGGVSLRHDGTIHQRLNAIRDALANAGKVTEAKLRDAVRLTLTDVDKQVFQRYVDDLLPLDPDSERPALRLQAREAVAWNFYSNPRQNLPGIERTAWAAYNAVSEFADHAGKFRSAESRFVSVTEGGADALKQRAFDKALAMV